MTTEISLPVRSPAPAYAERTATTRPAESPPLSPAALATVLIGALLPMIDFFIVNVALPTIGHDLHASDAMLELVVSGYAIAYAVLLVLGGRLGDAYGRRRLFAIGMAAFTTTSLLCGVAPTAATLVLARVVQGASAALMVPQTLSTIQATGNAASRSKALGWYGAAGGIAAVLGQALGGVLVSADIAGSGWRAIFLVNIPVGLAGLAMIGRFVPDTRATRAASVDTRGTILLAITLVSLLLPLTEGRSTGWPLWSWLLLALAPVAGAAFVLTERRLEASERVPLLPPSLLRLPSMRRGLLLGAPFFAGFGAFMFVFALLVQGALGYGPTKAGLALAPMGLTFLATSLLTARLVARFGRRVIGTGGIIQLVGLTLMIVTLVAAWPHVSALDLAPALAVTGIGQALVMTPLFRVVLSQVPPDSAGAGSGTLTTTQQVSLALGVAVLGSIDVTLAGPNHLGPMWAAVVVFATQTVIALGITIGSRMLPGGPTRRPVTAYPGE